MIEKKQILRKLEFTFTEDMVHPECHCAYENQIVEDGQVISRSNHREVKSCDEMKRFLSECECYVHPEVVV